MVRAHCSWEPGLCTCLVRDIMVLTKNPVWLARYWEHPIWPLFWRSTPVGWSRSGYCQIVRGVSSPNMVYVLREDPSDGAEKGAAVLAVEGTQWDLAQASCIMYRPTTGPACSTASSSAHYARMATLPQPCPITSIMWTAHIHKLYFMALLHTNTGAPHANLV